jgi:hypothetical protein
MPGRDDDPQRLGGHAGERRRQFERERGLVEAPELDLSVVERHLDRSTPGTTVAWTSAAHWAVASTLERSAARPCAV